MTRVIDGTVLGLERMETLLLDQMMLNF